MEFYKRLFSIVLVFVLANPIAGLSNNYGTSKTRQNYTDSNGNRQGYWQIRGAMSVEAGYKNDAIVEEGEYIDNKRQGLWKKYYPTGKLRSKINYESNRPFGDYTTYYPNGRIEEKGYWKGNKNTGEFKRYYENGQIAQDFYFTTKGKRDGEQKYYYENGKMKLSVVVENGIAHGMMMAYYPDGSVKSEKRITNGEVEEGSVKIYPPKSDDYEYVDTPILPVTETIPAKDKPNLAVFKESGFNTLYNKNQQLSQVGEFKEGRLWDGKWYRYDENGLLRKVEVYKEGRFIGYGIIDDRNN